MLQVFVLKAICVWCMAIDSSAILGAAAAISIALAMIPISAAVVAILPPLLGPMALSVAAQMGINPMALLVAVTFGSSAAFAMPIGYQTSLMILGPGGYRIKDFVKLGIVLDLLLGLLALWLIPRFWPLTLP